MCYIKNTTPLLSISTPITIYFHTYTINYHTIGSYRLSAARATGHLKTSIKNKIKIYIANEIKSYLAHEITSYFCHLRGGERIWHTYQEGTRLRPINPHLTSPVSLSMTSFLIGWDGWKPRGTRVASTMVVVPSDSLRSPRAPPASGPLLGTIESGFILLFLSWIKSFTFTAKVNFLWIYPTQPLQISKYLNIYEAIPNQFN